jgi:hypothetical protein
MSQYTGSVPATKRSADWRDEAVCRNEDPELFFPAGSTGPYRDQIEEAKAVCRRCPVIDACGRWALDTGQDTGIWGGLSEAERRTILRRRSVSRISTDDYTGTPRTITRARTLEEAWDAATESDGDHILWIGAKVVNRPGSSGITPNRLSFYLDRGHWPEGDTKRMCAVEGCVKPSHLADRRERAEETELAATG